MKVRYEDLLWGKPILALVLFILGSFMGFILPTETTKLATTFTPDGIEINFLLLYFNSILSAFALVSIIGQIRIEGVIKYFTLPLTFFYSVMTLSTQLLYGHGEENEVFWKVFGGISCIMVFILLSDNTPDPEYVPHPRLITD